MNKNRIFQYDFIRAFALVTVVASHIFTMFERTPLDFEIKEYINTISRFSVPIFLFLSGLFFKKTADLAYLKKKFLRILIPYSIISIPATIFICWKYEWGFQNLPEIILSYIFGYKFGHYFIFLILSLYLIGYFLVKSKLVKKINLLLLAILILQLVWLAADSFIYKGLGLHELKFFQFQLNDFAFYRNPLTWLFFFVLGLWYQETRSKELVSKNRTVITIFLILSFLFYNLQIFFNFGDYTPYGSIIWSVFSTSIIFFLLNLSVKKWKSSKIINYLSQQSLPTFLIHYFFIYLLVEIQRLTEITFPYAMTLIFFPIILITSVAVVEVSKIFTEKKKCISSGTYATAVVQ